MTHSGSDSGSGQKAAEVPKAPHVVTSEPGCASLYFTWNNHLSEVAPVTSFDLRLEHDDLLEPVDLPDKGLSYAANITGLHSSKNYTIHLRANNSVGGSQWMVTELRTVGAEPPPTPHEASLNQVQETGPRAEFKIQPVGDGGSTLTHALLKIGETSQTCTIPPYNRTSRTDDFPIFSCDIDVSLQESLFVSTAFCNDAGCSAFTGGVECLFVNDQGLCTRPNPPPNPPANLTVQSSYPISITWEASRLTNGRVNPDVVGYEISITDPWNSAGLTIVGRVDKTNYFNSTVLPGTEYSVRVRAATVDSTSDWSEVLTFTTTAQKTCGNTADVQQWRYHYFKGDLVSTSKSCGLEHFASRSGCEQCLKDQLGLSMDCGGCWYDEGKCTVHHCATKCSSFGSAKSCQDCWDTNCSPAFQACTGMPTFTYPPLKT